MVQERSVTDSESAAIGFTSFATAAMSMQRELLQTYERMGRLWLERMQVEVALWTRLVGELSSSRSASDILKAYTDGMSKQLRMSAEDGQHILDDCQEIARKFARVQEVYRADDLESEEDDDDLAAEPRVTH